MDEQNYQPQSPMAAAPAPVEKKSSSRGMIIAVVITILVLGAGGYLVFAWQKSVWSGTADQQVKTLQAEGDTCQTGFAACQASKTALDQQMAEVNKEIDAIVKAPYQGWQSYTDTKLGLQWQYPANWKVTEKTISSTQSPINKKNGFCLLLTPADGGSMTICYRLKTDSNSTTWFRSGAGYGEVAKVGIRISMADKMITEKTYFGQNGKVLDIIYAQNLKDDETGYGARFAIGDYYFTAMAEDLSGISSDTQEKMDLVLGSLALPTIAPASVPVQ